MKSLKLLALAILIGGTSIFASEIKDPDPVTPIPLLRAQIIELLPDAFFGDIDESLVKVYFTYGSEGEIVVLKVDTTNKLVKQYIRRYLNQRKVDQPGEIGKLYYLPLKIKPEA